MKRPGKAFLFGALFAFSYSFPIGEIVHWLMNGDAPHAWLLSVCAGYGVINGVLLALWEMARREDA